MQVFKEGVKPCKYNKTGQNCPFDEIGCKFKHECNIQVSENHCENAEVFRMVESDMDGNKIVENDDKRAEEEANAVESNTDDQNVSVVDFQESDETECEDQDNDEEAECDVDDNEYVCI